MSKRIKYIGFFLLILGFVISFILPLFVEGMKFAGAGGIINIVVALGMVGFSYYSEYSSKKFIENSVPTFGTLLAMKQTGMYVNNQPQIKFTVEIIKPDGTKVQADFKKTIAMIEMAQFSVGMTVPVRYNKEDPTKMAFDLSSNQEELQKAYDQSLIKKGELDPELLEISKNGLAGTAIVLISRPTGKLTNKKVEMELRLAVTGDNGETFEVDMIRGINQRIIAALQVGSVVNVNYLNHDHSKLSLRMAAV